MLELKAIKCLPDSPELKEFELLPTRLYPEGSQRFKYGNDPVELNLEGRYVVKNGNDVIARFTFYINPEMVFEGKKVCTFGSFECIDDQTAVEFIVDELRRLAKENNSDLILGPMEGSTWSNYRFSDNNDHPSFFMEPYHHAYYPMLIERSGFKPFAHYVSNLDTQLNYNKQRIVDFEATLEAAGASVRSLDMKDLEADLTRIGEFCNDAFASNVLFTPIDPKLFAKKYMSLKELFNPELIWIVEDVSGKIQAVSFSIKDYFDPKGETIIVKSLARRPDSPFRGIGSFLSDKTYEVVEQQGYKKVIHAFMIAQNRTVEMSKGFAGNVYKTYTLFGMEL